MNEISCNGCRACCQYEALVLHPEMGDKPREYLCVTMTNPLTGNLVFALARKENGECIYLGPEGCTNYINRPAICREFDCRKFYLKVKQGNVLMKLASDLAGDEVLKEGEKRLHTL